MGARSARRNVSAIARDGGLGLENIEQLIEEYARSLPGHLNALFSAVNAARAAHWDDVSRAEVRNLAHRLSGAALTYGFQEIGLGVRQIETLIRTEPRLDAAALEPLLDTILHGIEDHLDRSAKTLSPGTTKEIRRVREPEGPISTVMLVDDDAELTAFLVAHLRSLGFDAHGFNRFDDAVRSASILQPRCLLLDVMFPGQGDAGFELGEAIAAELDLPPTTIFLTSREDLAARRRAAALGAHSYLCKPVNLTTLGLILEHQFSSHRQVRSRVLLVEDSVPIARVYSLLMKRAGMETVSVHDPFLLLDAVYHFQPDLILLDLNLPGIGGAELCALLRQHETLFDLPLIGLTSETDPAVLRRAMQAGLDGILRKDDEPEAVIPVIRNRIARHRRVRHSMMRDMLTGLLNRSALLERLDLELLRGQRTRRPLSLAIADIDHFKQINDRLGHLAGDAALKHVARLVSSRLRSIDFAGRLGGDEFLVVMPNTPVADAANVMGEIAERIRTTPHIHRDQQLRITMSVGLVEHVADAVSPARSAISQMMGRADDLLYEAKRQGRDRVVHLAPPHHD